MDVPAFIDGGRGRDHLIGGHGEDFILGGPGNDHLFGGSGDDFLDGGDADDHVHGNIGHDILVGGAGADKLFGDAGLDVLIGGLGTDLIQGGQDDDIEIGATVTLDDTMLRAVRHTWTRGASYSSRVTSLSHALLKANQTVLDDGSEDALYGNAGRDLFFAKLGGARKDKVKDKKSNESLIELY